MSKTAALYARVSTSDQDCGYQLAELRDWARRFNFEIFKEYVDTGYSGAKTNRPALDQLMQAARERRFDVVLVWKLDRLGRTSRQLINNIEDLKSNKVRFVAISQMIDTDESNAMATVLFQVMGAFAELERSLISERVRSGVAHAKAAGKQLGRPRKVFRRDLAEELRRGGLSFRQIGEKLGVSYRTVMRELATKSSTEMTVPAADNERNVLPLLGCDTK